MGLHNIPVAEAILRLFEVKYTWQELEAMEPQDEVLKQIKRFIIQQDELRAGELPLTRPDIDIMRVAFTKGCRLRFVLDKGNDYLHVISPQNKIVQLQIRDFLGLLYPELIWRTLSMQLTGKKCPAYDLQDIGEIILNEFSIQQYKMRQSLMGRDADTLSERNGELKSYFDVKKCWALTTISDLKIKYLESALNKLLRQTGTKPPVITLNLVTAMVRDNKAPQINSILYERQVKRLYLNVGLLCQSAHITNQMDFPALMNAYKEVMNAETEKTKALSIRPGNRPTTSEFFTRCQFDPYVEIEGMLTKEEMEAEVKGLRNYATLKKGQ